MAKGPETRLQRKIQDFLRDKYGSDLFLFKVWGSEFQLAGLPDLLGCYKGRFVALEVKTPETRTKLSERQKYVMRLISAAGGTVGVVTSTDDADVIIRSIPGSQR
jgi:hypothetical protein